MTPIAENRMLKNPLVTGRSFLVHMRCTTKARPQVDLEEDVQDGGAYDTMRSYHRIAEISPRSKDRSKSSVALESMGREAK